jgi:hypothetical protein
MSESQLDIQRAAVPFGRVGLPQDCANLVDPVPEEGVGSTLS